MDEPPFELGEGHIGEITKEIATVLAKGGRGEVTIVLEKGRIATLRTTTSRRFLGNGLLSTPE